ncbi:MAG: 4Fe-4S ferredoxin, iron-sulfur binding, partial [uncultured Rubrobacteraceae bacterium]
DRRLCGLRSLHKDLPGEGHPARAGRVLLAPNCPRRPLHGVRRVRRGLPRLGLRRGTPTGGRV